MCEGLVEEILSAYLFQCKINKIIFTIANEFGKAIVRYN